MNTDGVKSYVTNAISYWEFRRIIYNAVLAVIVIGYFCRQPPSFIAAYYTRTNLCFIHSRCSREYRLLRRLHG